MTNFKSIPFEMTDLWEGVESVPPCVLYPKDPMCKELMGLSSETPRIPRDMVGIYHLGLPEGYGIRYTTFPGSREFSIRVINPGGLLGSPIGFCSYQSVLELSDNMQL